MIYMYIFETLYPFDETGKNNWPILRHCVVNINTLTDEDIYTILFSIVEIKTDKTFIPTVNCSVKCKKAKFQRWNRNWTIAQILSISNFYTKKNKMGIMMKVVIEFATGKFQLGIIVGSHNNQSRQSCEVDHVDISYNKRNLLWKEGRILEGIENGLIRRYDFYKYWLFTQGITFSKLRTAENLLKLIEYFQDFSIKNCTFQTTWYFIRWYVKFIKRFFSFLKANEWI